MMLVGLKVFVVMLALATMMVGTAPVLDSEYRSTLEEIGSLVFWVVCMMGLLWSIFLVFLQ